MHARRFNYFRLKPQHAVQREQFSPTCGGVLSHSDEPFYLRRGRDVGSNRPADPASLKH